MCGKLENRERESEREREAERKATVGTAPTLYLHLLSSLRACARQDCLLIWHGYRASNDDDQEESTLSKEMSQTTTITPPSPAPRPLASSARAPRSSEATGS